MAERGRVGYIYVQVARGRRGRGVLGLLLGVCWLPRIGLLSDSHGRGATTRDAVDLLVAQGAQRLIHLGDVGSLEVIDALLAVDAGGKPVPAHVVFGNVDWDADSLGDYARELGIRVDHPMGNLDLGAGRTLAYTHGHRGDLMEQALAKSVTYLCHGHSHTRVDERRGSTRVINPGALFRAREYTVALLDTEADRLSFFSLE